MGALILIWTTAAGLALAALLWMSALILMRVLHDRRMAARARSRRQVEAALLGIIQGSDPAMAQLGPFARRARLMAEVLLEFFGIIRGQDQDRVLAALRNLRVDAALRRQAGRGAIRERLVCLEALAVFPGPETQAALEKAAFSRRSRLRLAALRSLAAVGGEVTVDRLLDDLVAGALRPSGAFGEFMRTVVASDTAAATAAAARSDLTPAARAILLEALGESGDYNALPLLVAQADAAEFEVRVAAINALGRLRHPAAEPALLRAMSDPEWPVRASASEAAGAGRLAGLAAALTDALADPVWRVRFQAAAALPKLGQQGVAALQNAAEGPRDAASLAASLALAERGA